MRTLKTSVFTVFCILMIQSTLFAQSANITEGCPPLSVEFTAVVAQAGFFWNFQNGATSAEMNPSAVFTQAGVYNVTLQETSNGPVIATLTINVYPIPDLSITADPTMGCAPTPVSFISTSTIDPAITIDEYSWVFGGGNSGTGIAPTTAYNQPGTYTVSLNVQTELEGCSTTTIFPDFITLGGVTGLSFFTIPTPLISCDPPLDVQIFNVIPPGLASYTWDFGNGQTFDGIDPPNQIYAESGTYSIILTGEDNEGCTATRQRTVRVVDPLESLSFPDTVCLNNFIYYDAFAFADSLRWTFPPSTSLSIDINEERYVVFHEGGLQEITLSAINTSPFYCEKDTTFNVFVHKVIAELTADPTYTCEHELEVNFSATASNPSTFFWDFNEEGNASGAEVSYTYTHLDTTTHGMNGLNQFYTILLAVNSVGCTDTVLHIDTIYDPNALFMPDVVSGCMPLIVNFTDYSSSLEPITEWFYDYGDGFTETLTNDEDHTHTFTDPGTYEVFLHIVNETGCRDTSYVRIIEVGEPLDLDYVYDNNDVCYGDTIGYSLIDPPEEIDWVHLMEPDTLYAYYNGCLTQVSNPDITVHGPNVKMEYEIDCEAPFTVNFDGEYFDVEIVVWDFDDGETSTALNPVHIYDEVGDYWVKVTASNSNFTCPSVTDSMLICIRDLQADFILPEAICANETIELDATITNDANKNQCAGGFTWYFDLNGRPIQGNDTLLMHTFGVPGQEYVTLITKDINGCRDTIRKMMNIYSITPSFVADDELICMPATVNFTDLSISDTTLVSWNWDFGDTEMSDSEEAAVHTYNNLIGPNVDVILTLEDAQGCMVVDTISLNIYTPISSVITDPSPSNICIGETINFTGAQFTDGGSSLEFSWNFGNGIPIAAQEISQTYEQAGSFPLNMHFIEVASGCQGDAEAVVNVQDFPIAAFSSSEDGAEAICFPAQISFTDESISTSAIATYSWDFGNGDAASGPNPTVTFDRGTFTVDLVVGTSFGCTDETSQIFEVVGPDGSFTFGPAAICEGEEVTFTLVDTMDISSFSWNFGDGNAVDDVNPVTHAFDNIAQLGQFPVVLILRGAADQCVVDVTQFIEIHDVRADFSLNNGGDFLLCAGEYPFINTSTGGHEYTWTFNDGSMSNEFEPTQTFTPGQYDISLQVTNQEFGCEDELNLSFEFFSPPGIMALGDTICPGDTATLQVLNIEPAWEYNWTPAFGLFPASNISNPMVMVETTTDFQVQVTDTIGCISNQSVSVDVIQPFLFEDIDVVRCPGDSLNLDLPIPEGFFNVFWSPIAPPEIIGEDDLDLTLTIEDILGCFSDDYSIFIQSLSDSIALPNIFSPNGDGINETFRLFSKIDFERTDLVIIKSFTVFNRWGQKVYEGSGPNAFWDGNVNDKPAPSDVYIYQIMVDVLKSNKVLDLKGSVTLIR